jgi:hypothetical protein
MRNNLFDRVIVSSDDSPMFLNFWPCVSRAWLKFFDIQPTLALVSNRPDTHPLFSRLRQFGEVYKIEPVSGIPISNQAKLARFILASKMHDQVCMIEDIDTIPLQRNFVEALVKRRKPQNLLAVGHEVYEIAGSKQHRGKFPISNITAEGEVFKKLINPYGLCDSALIESFVGMRVFDLKEDISNDPSCFSDESLIRALIYNHDLEHLVQKEARYVNPLTDWIDRSWWMVDEEKLNRGGYVACNFLRPCKPNAFRFNEIYKYIYGFLPRPDEVFVV